MKAILITVTLLFTASAFAQTGGVNVNEIEEGTTTLEIKKTRGEKAKTGDPLWEVQDGSADLEGESAATAKEAKDAWKKACNDWKKEFRADNKENKILSINCGSSTCGGEVGQKTCTSKRRTKSKRN